MDFFALETLALSEQRLDVLRSVGQMVSAAIERIYQADKQTMAATDAMAVNKVLQELGKADDSKEAIRTALDTVRSAFGLGLRFILAGKCR